MWEGETKKGQKERMIERKWNEMRNMENKRKLEEREWSKRKGVRDREREERMNEGLKG